MQIRTNSLLKPNIRMKAEDKLKSMSHEARKSLFEKATLSSRLVSTISPSVLDFSFESIHTCDLYPVILNLLENEITEQETFECLQHLNSRDNIYISATKHNPFRSYQYNHSSFIDRIDEPATKFKLLVENGANLNIENAEGQTPLTLAIEKNDLPLIVYLLKHGAQTEFRLKNNEIILEYSINNAHIILNNRVKNNYDNSLYEKVNEDLNAIFNILLESSSNEYLQSQAKHLLIMCLDRNLQDHRDMLIDKIQILQKNEIIKENIFEQVNKIQFSKITELTSKIIHWSEHRANIPSASKERSDYYSKISTILWNIKPLLSKEEKLELEKLLQFAIRDWIKNSSDNKILRGGYTNSRDCSLNLINTLLEKAKSKGWDLINTQDEAGNTLFLVAVQHGQLDVVEFLLKHNADPTIKNNEGMSALMYFAQNMRSMPQKMIDTFCDMKFLFEKMRLDTKSQEGQKIIETLLSSILVMNNSFYSYSSLSYQVETLYGYLNEIDLENIPLTKFSLNYHIQNGEFDLAREFIQLAKDDFGIDYIRSVDGEPPHLKIHDFVHNLSALQFLITLGADINGQNELGNTALHESSRIECISYLLENNADFMIPNHQGRLPIFKALNEIKDLKVYNEYDDLAHKNLERRILQLADWRKIVKLYLTKIGVSDVLESYDVVDNNSRSEYDGYTDERDYRDRTLPDQRGIDDLDELTFYEKIDFDPNQTLLIGKTRIHVFAENGLHDCLHHTLGTYSHINLLAKDHQGATAIDLAIKNNKAFCVSLLLDDYLDQGGDPFIVLNWAMVQGKLEMLYYILDHTTPEVLENTLLQKDSENNDLFHYLISNQDVQTIKIIISRLPKEFILSLIHKKDSSKESHFIISIQNNFREISELFFHLDKTTARIAINEIDKDGNSLLMREIINYNIEESDRKILVMLTFGANISQINILGQNPLKLAIYYKHKPCANLIIKAHIQEQRLQNKPSLSLDFYYENIHNIDTMYSKDDIYLNKKTILQLFLQHIKLLSDLIELEEIPEFQVGGELRKEFENKYTQVEDNSKFEMEALSLAARHPGNQIHAVAQTGIGKALYKMQHLFPMHIELLEKSLTPPSSIDEFKNLIVSLLTPEKATKALKALDRVLESRYGHKQKILENFNRMTTFLMGCQADDDYVTTDSKIATEQAKYRLRIWLDNSLVESNLSDETLSCDDGIVERFLITGLQNIYSVIDCYFDANSYLTANEHSISPTVLLSQEPYATQIAFELNNKMPGEISTRQEEILFSKACMKIFLKYLYDEFENKIIKIKCLTPEDHAELKSIFVKMLYAPPGDYLLNSYFTYFSESDDLIDAVKRNCLP